MSDSLTSMMPGAPGAPGTEVAPAAPGEEVPSPSPSPDAGKTSDVSPAVVKFKSCRWRRPPEDGPECCGHRDVLPIAGTSFNPEAWCPDCTFFKLRRTPKKRSPEDYRY
ncbi:MAG TPA: hypothetical protein VGY48_09025 [Vicinamibacterales bacterium]|jgi:hypothetical protein|nr:hypothetical protein [Vicinamibacterales bacterium]